VSAAPGRPGAGELDALDAILAALGDWLRDAGPAARGELRACLHRVITWPWPEDMHIAVTCCRLTLHGRITTGGSQ
jgi:hypothetical protein